MAVIVVGVDGSPTSERALEWAMGEAAAHGDNLLLVHAWEYPAVGMTTYAGDALPVFGRDDLEKVADRMLRAVAESAVTVPPGVRVATRLVEGRPADALIEAAREARLLVVGSRGLGGFRGMLMGSVSTSCAHHARCPVVIVPPTSAAEAA